jgi:hypothetical protein
MHIKPVTPTQVTSAGGRLAEVPHKIGVEMSPDLATLWEGGLQKEGGLCLALGYQVCDTVIRENFRIHLGRD